MAVESPASAPGAPRTEPSHPPTPAVLLFQKAHQKIALLARLDEQVVQILNRRRQLQEELRLVQQEINGEFDRLIRLVDDAPPAVRAHVVTGPARSERPAERPPEPRRVNQFAGAPIGPAAAAVA
jgi:hypothetical protein